MPNKSTLILMATIVALVVFLVFAGPAACNKIRSLASQSKVNTGQSEAFRESVEDTNNVQRGVYSREREAERLSRSNEEEIRNAKGADTRVDPELNAAGLRALCRRPSRRDNTECRVFKSDTK